VRLVGAGAADRELRRPRWDAMRGARRSVHELEGHLLQRFRSPRVVNAVTSSSSAWLQKLNGRQTLQRSQNPARSQPEGSGACQSCAANVWWPKRRAFAAPVKIDP